VARTDVTGRTVSGPKYAKRRIEGIMESHLSDMEVEE
jgi:hypothetical protein